MVRGDIDTPKANAERRVFRRFVQSVGLPVPVDSVRSRPEPEPHILCQIADEGLVAFELVSIDGSTFRSEHSTYDKTVRDLADAYLRGGGELQIALASKFGPVQLIVYVNDRLSARLRRADRNLRCESGPSNVATAGIGGL